MPQRESQHSPAKDLSAYQVRVVPEEWNTKLLALSRQSPVRAGKLSIHFDRSPNIFAIPKLTSYRYRPLGFFHEDQLVGFAIAAYQKRYIQGVVTDVIYLGNMHVIEKGTGWIFLKKLVARLKQKIQELPEVQYVYACVMVGNTPAMKLVDRRVLDTEMVGAISMSSLFTIKPVSPSRKYTVRKARPDDIASIVELLSGTFQKRFLAPEINKDIFIRNLERRPGIDIEDYYVALQGDTIAGVCLTWDMTSIKKNRVWFHGIKMNVLRQAYNVAARLSGSPLLPESGEAFKDVTIAEHSVQNRDPDIMEALLRYVYREYRRRGYQSLIFGCSSDDPLLKATHPFFSQEVRSRVLIAPLQENAEPSFGNAPLIYADAIQI